jgi:biotin carboxyl carrier protein
MKLFTTIYAEIDGRVTEICAENAAPVEYGQMLFTIEPAG